MPAGLSPAERRAAAVGQAGEAAAGGAPAVEVKAPIPGFMTPQLLHEAYELPDETAAGTGQTVAVVDAFDDPTAEADLGVFDKQFGLPPCTTANGCFRKINQTGAASPLPRANGGWGSEISIDVQMAHAICQDCHIVLAEANGEGFGNLTTAVGAAARAGATEISNSYAAPERFLLALLFASAYNRPGTVVTAGAGDCGYLNEDCGGERHAAEFPADSPNVVAVGGTSLRDVGGSWTSSAWAEGGSGCSSLFAAPAWQSGVANFAATGCGLGRAVADASAIGDPNTGVDVYDSTPDGEGDPTGWGVWGGTSVSSPIVAAEFALAGGSHGVADPAATLYSHAGEAGALYDVVNGSNGVCAQRSICRAGVGYDGPTGVGSPTGLGAFAISP